MYLHKVENVFYWLLDKVAKKSYIKRYPRYLKRLGVKISESPGDCWISPTIFLDSAGYDRISIGDNCTISFDVAILVHDYSVNTAFRAVNIAPEERHRMTMRDVIIGNNCFIGARAVILPGTVLGDDCIIGAGAVVRGTFASRSVIIGNPAKAVSTVDIVAKKRSDREDYIFDNR